MKVFIPVSCHLLPIQNSQILTPDLRREARLAPARSGLASQIVHLKEGKELAPQVSLQVDKAATDPLALELGLELFHDRHFKVNNELIWSHRRSTSGLQRLPQLRKGSSVGWALLVWQEEECSWVGVSIKLSQERVKLEKGLRSDVKGTVS